MDFLEFGDVGRGCEGENCSRASGLLESCSDQECQWEEGVFGVMELVCVTIIYVPLMLFGLLGNVLTILVVWLRPDMRSSTYLYLSSMAVSDLLILLLLPLDLYKLWRPKPWPLGDFACKLTMFLSECCTFCTILHITFLSLERYLAVCWPITAKTLVTRRRTRAVIGCLWLGAAVSAAPVLIMVGVEEVGGEEQGLGGWSEGGGLSSGEGEHAAFLIGEREREHLASLNGGLVRLEWEEKERWAERVGELKESEGEGEKGSGEEEEKKQGDEGGAEEGKGEESKMKEDEGGGSNGGETDMSECRCTDFAVSSGLLKAMMILSNLYFLIPLCVLALVYSLIGRTLWLRPHSSRRDQSHRHTVKMLGVIVLAFVLCWLPFHVGRTVFSLSLGSDMQETDTNSHSDAPHDVGGGGSINTLAVSHPDSETHLEPAKMTAHAHRQNDLCDVSAGTKVSTDVDGENEIHADMSKHNNTDPPANAHTVNTDLHGDDTHNVTFAHFDAHFYYYLSQYLNLVSSVLFYLSAAVNPLLYNLMSSRYRHAVHSLIHTHCDTHPRRRPAVTAQHSTTTM